MLTLLPGLKTIIRRHVHKLKLEIENSKDKKIVKDLKNDVFVSVFNEVSNYITLGDGEEAEMAKIDGKTLSSMIKDSVQRSTNFGMSALNNFTFGLAAKYNLGSDLT